MKTHASPYQVSNLSTLNTDNALQSQIMRSVKHGSDESRWSNNDSQTSVWQLATGFPLKSLERTADVLIRVLRNHFTWQMSTKTHTTCCFLSPVTGQLSKMLVVWCSHSALVSINEVNQRRARLVLGWVTMSRFNYQWQTFISVCDQSPRSTQPGHSFVGRRSEYQPNGGDALRLGSKGRHGPCVGGR